MIFSWGFIGRGRNVSICDPACVRVMAIWPVIRGVGYASGVASVEAGGADSDRGKQGAVVGTSEGDDTSSKDDASKGEGAVVKPRSKIPQQPGQPSQPGSQVSREIWVCQASRAKNQAWP